MDVLAPGIGEIIGGSQREEGLEVLDRSIAERGIDREHYARYRDLRRYGTCRSPLPPPLAGEGGVGASASSAPSPASPASPTCATPSPARARRGTQSADFVLLQAVGS
jgi:tRNA synthetases class II (D, K and N)